MTSMEDDHEGEAWRRSMKRSIRRGMKESHEGEALMHFYLLVYFYYVFNLTVSRTIRVFIRAVTLKQVDLNPCR